MFARTERLLLRPGWAEDAAPLAAAIGDEAILTKLAKAPSPYKLADAQEFLGYDRREGDADFLVVARTGGAPRLVGGVGLHPDGEDLELGFWIARPYWGLGFATEAARAVIDIARHTLRRPRLVSGHFIDNPASGRSCRSSVSSRLAILLPGSAVLADMPCRAGSLLWTSATPMTATPGCRECLPPDA